MTDAALTLRRPPRTDWLWAVPPLAVISVLFFYPLILIARQGLTEGGKTAVTLDHFAAVIRTRQFHSALLNTIEIALASSAGCLVLGFIIALILAFVPFRGSRECARFI